MGIIVGCLAYGVKANSSSREGMSPMFVAGSTRRSRCSRRSDDRHSGTESGSAYEGREPRALLLCSIEKNRQIQFPTGTFFQEVMQCRHQLADHLPSPRTQP